MNTTWKIANLERTNDTDAVVTIAHYRVEGSDGEYSQGAYGTMAFEGDPSAEGFIAFDALTEDVVIGWVKDKFGDEKVAEIEAAIAEKIEVQKNPPTVAGLPWAVEAAE